MIVRDRRTCDFLDLKKVVQIYQKRENGYKERNKKSIGSEEMNVRDIL